MNIFRNKFLRSTIALSLLTVGSMGYAQAGSAAASIKGAAASAPTPAALASGDPSGTLTGTTNDVPVANAKAGLTAGDVANLAGQNKVAINFVWTLVTGFLVMFM